MDPDLHRESSRIRIEKAAGFALRKKAGSGSAKNYCGSIPQPCFKTLIQILMRVFLAYQTLTLNRSSHRILYQKIQVLDIVARRLVFLCFRSFFKVCLRFINGLAQEVNKTNKINFNSDPQHCFSVARTSWKFLRCDL